jgi:hypothetical protein
LSWKLVGEVLAFTSRQLDLHPRDRLILLTIAEEARDPGRSCSPGPGVLAGRVGLSGRGLRKAMQRLSRRGLEVRVPVMVGADGRPVFAVPGRLQVYRVPPLPVASSLVAVGGTGVPPDGTPGPPAGTQGPPAGTQGPPDDPSEGHHATPSGPPDDPSGGGLAATAGAATPTRGETPSPLALSPSTPNPLREVDDAHVDELERVVVGAIKGKASIPGRTTLRRECSRLARLQWTPVQLQAVVEGHDWTGAGAGAVITFLRQLQAPGTALNAVQDRPAWCGRCNETTRLLESPQGGVQRCPTCHPLTRKDPA